MKANCLTRALDQWDEKRQDYKLWYNSNHVVCLDKGYIIISSFEPEYLALNNYGLEYFNDSFQLSFKYVNLLNEYLKTE